MDVSLGFAPTPTYVSSAGTVGSLDKGLTVFNANTGYLWLRRDGIPQSLQAADKLRQFLATQQGNLFYFDHIEQAPAYMLEALEVEAGNQEGPEIVSSPGTMMVPLESVTNWYEADSISDKSLRELLRGPSATRNISLAKARDGFSKYKATSDLRRVDDWPGGYFAVLTKQGTLSVVQVRQFKDADIRVRIMPRSEKRSGLLQPRNATN